MSNLEILFKSCFISLGIACFVFAHFVWQSGAGMHDLIGRILFTGIPFTTGLVFFAFAHFLWNSMK